MDLPHWDLLFLNFNETNSVVEFSKNLTHLFNINSDVGKIEIRQSGVFDALL